MPDERIHLIESLAANAWPAQIIQIVDGWRLRYNQGVNRRANSVWPNQAGGALSLDVKIAAIEDFYIRWDIRPRFQMTPAAQPANLAEILAARGYSTSAHTSVQIAPLPKVLAHTQANPSHALTLTKTLSEPWLHLYRQAEALDSHTVAMRRATLNRIGPRRAFVQLHLNDIPAAVGLGVLERGWVGVFCMATLPDYRRRRAATTLLHALAEWGREHGAANMYLQVMQINTPALALYARAGFETLYHYYYAEGPVP